MKYMEAVGVQAHVDRAYEASETYQWAREAVVNALQAKATKINFGIEWQAVQKSGVYRRTITDNGTGINGRYMPAFLNKFGGGGKTIGDTTGNFGIGFKTSCLPWNRKGVVVLSVTTENNVVCVNMMWLCEAKRTVKSVTGGTKTITDYGAVELLDQYLKENADDVDDIFSAWVAEGTEDATTVLPLDLLKDAGCSTEIGGIDWWKAIPAETIKEGHGTVIVLLGNKIDEHTIKGDPGREQEGETKYGLLRYLNTRLYELPKGVSITVTTLGAETEGGEWEDCALWPKVPGSKGVGKRAVVGLHGVIENYKEKAASAGGRAMFESVTIHNAPVPVEVDTHLFPDIKKSARTQGGYNVYTSGVQPSLPIIASVRKCHSDLDLTETFDCRTQKDAKEALHRWINIDTIRKRLVLVLRPLDSSHTRVFSDQSRRTLLYRNKTKGGASMPEIEWADAYKTKRPEFMSKEIAAYFSEMPECDANIDKNIIEKLKQHFRFMASTVPELRRPEKPEQSENTAQNTRNGGGGRRVPRLQGAEGDRSYGVERGLIVVKCGETSDPRFPIELNFDQAEPVGIVHVTHPLIHDAWMCCKEKLDADCVEEAEMDTYYSAFKGQVMGHVACALTHIWAFIRKGNLSLRDEMMKPAALASIAAGIQHFKQAAQGPFGTIKAGKLIRK